MRLCCLRGVCKGLDCGNLHVGHFDFPDQKHVTDRTCPNCLRGLLLGSRRHLRSEAAWRQASCPCIAHARNLSMRSLLSLQACHAYGGMHAANAKTMLQGAGALEI